MYKKNKRSQQPLLISDINDLPERSLKYLRSSWADTFRREVFLRIPEDRFAILYDPDPSRPNVPVNVLVGLDIIKEGCGWSDQELYEHFLFDMQVRYALGCDNFGEGDFDLRTLYYFRKRVSQHAFTTGENLYQAVFNQVTGEQIQKLGVKTDLQRMDSTQLLSNIADLSRLELLVEVLQRLYRILSAEDQATYGEIFAAYIKESAGQYTYQIKGKEAVWERIQQLGLVLHELLIRLAEMYAEQPIYQVAQRFFDENFYLLEDEVKAKTNKEIQAGCLQSLDDLEASYRVKGSRAYKGYVGNLSETCHPENPLQLIVHTQTAENRTADTQLLKDALPELKERTDLNKIITDGGYVGPEIDQAMRKQEVEQITTGLTGTLPDHQDGKLAFSDFDMGLSPAGEVIQATCPAGYSATIQPAPSGKSFRLLFAPTDCQACAFYQQGQCPVQINPKKGLCFLTVPKDRANSSQRRRRFEQCKEEARNLRPAVEATVFQVKHTLRGGKLRVRGLFRVACVFTCAALAVNLRRINRYENDRQRGKFTSKKGRKAFLFAISTAWKALLAPYYWLRLGSCLCFSC
jgi:hypothetical protein